MPGRSIERAGRVAAVTGALLLALAAVGPTRAEDAAAPPAAASGRLYAVEIRTGPAWDAAKPANEQAYFREHSAHLRKLRDDGVLVLGARFSDKGFIVLRAGSATEARAMLDQDASIRNLTFRYELHDFNVFYGGAVQPPPRPPGPR